MKLLTSLLAALLIPVFALAEVTGSPTLWEKAAYGDIPGVQFVRIDGYNGAITTTAEAIWPESAAYTVLRTAMSSPYCASTDANDDGSPAGTGAQTIRVTGITTDFAAFSEDLTLDGQTSVDLTTANIMMINKVEVLTAGSGTANIGVIRCGTGTNTSGNPAVDHAHISGYYVTSQHSWYGVPEGYTLVCKDLTFSSYGATAGQSIALELHQHINKTLPRATPLLAALNQGGTNHITLPNLLVFPEKSQLIFNAKSAASTGPVSLRVDCLLIEDAWKTSSQDIF